MNRPKITTDESGGACVRFDNLGGPPKQSLTWIESAELVLDPRIDRVSASIIVRGQRCPLTFSVMRDSGRMGQIHVLTPHPAICFDQPLLNRDSGSPRDASAFVLVDRDGEPVYHRRCPEGLGVPR